MSTNPYAAPEAPLGIEEGRLPEGPARSLATFRTAHLPVERVVSTLGNVLMVWGTAGLTLGLLTLGLMGLGAMSAGTDLFEGLAVLAVFTLVLLGPASVPLVLGLGLRRYAPWARVATMAFAIPLFLLIPVGTWLGWRMLDALSSDSGHALFTQEHTDARAATPEMAVKVLPGLALGGVLGPLAMLIILFIVG